MSGGRGNGEDKKGGKVKADGASRHKGGTHRRGKPSWKRSLLSPA